MKTKLYYVVVALVLASSAGIFAAHSSRQSAGFVLHQKGYQFDAQGNASLSFTSEVFYNSDGSYFEVKHHTNGRVQRDLWSAEDGSRYRITKERVYRMGDYVPLAAKGVLQGEPVEVAGVAAVRVQPRDDRTGKPYVIADFAPGLQNALVGLQAFNAEHVPVDKLETVSIEHKDAPAEYFKLPAGVAVERLPPPSAQKQ